MTPRFDTWLDTRLVPFNSLKGGIINGFKSAFQNATLQRYIEAELAEERRRAAEEAGNTAAKKAETVYSHHHNHTVYRYTKPPGPIVYSRHHHDN